MDGEIRKTARYSRSRHIHNETAPDKVSYIEVIISQCVVCAVFLVFVAVLCLFNAEDFGGLRGSLKSALTNNINTNDVTGVTEGITKNIKSLFNKEAEVQTVPENFVSTDVVQEEIKLAEEEEPLVVLPVVEDLNDFRIDEDILTQINSKEDFYAEEAKKQMATQTSENIQ